ncbi:MAG: HEAT repeat domain-containing protein [Planctomycetes bacterium]|nr:HEAT repeat domain-containing protein [Planctomycetota bacterium]
MDAFARLLARRIREENPITLFDELSKMIAERAESDGGRIRQACALRILPALVEREPKLRSMVVPFLTTEARRLDDPGAAASALAALFGVPYAPWPGWDSKTGRLTGTLGHSGLNRPTANPWPSEVAEIFSKGLLDQDSPLTEFGETLDFALSGRPDEYVRIAVHALGLHPDPARTEVLLRFLETRHRPLVARAAADSLGRYPPNPQIEAALVAAAQSYPGFFVRDAALQSLASLYPYGERVEELLLSLLLDPQDLKGRQVVRLAESAARSVARFYQRFPDDKGTREIVRKALSGSLGEIAQDELLVWVSTEGRQEWTTVVRDMARGQADSPTIRRFQYVSEILDGVKPPRRLLELESDLSKIPEDDHSPEAEERRGAIRDEIRDVQRFLPPEPDR